jgi:long-chain fatty acid transport protein
LLDASYVDFSGTFTRQVLATAANGGQYLETSPTAHGSTPFLPIPTVGFSYAFGSRNEWTAAVGAFAPYTPVVSYPASAESRYSVVSLDGSALADTGLWLAYKPIEQIRVGVGVELLVGTFASSVVMNTNPQNRLLGAPEEPQYDALSQLDVGPIVAPSGNAGVTVVPERHVRVGIAGQLPTHIDAPATIQVRLPSASVFDHATVSGDQGRVVFNLPGVFRAGVEVRPVDALRVELAYVHEFWSNHTEIDVIPNGISISGITGFPPDFKVRNITIPRHFQDADSLRLGGEYGIPIGSQRLDVRAGAALESSAVPAAYESALTVDMNKLTLSLGAGFHLGPHWRVDLVYAHILGESVNVAPATAAVPPINPVQGNATPQTSINGGTYTAQADIFGLGANYAF